MYARTHTSHTAPYTAFGTHVKQAISAGDTLRYVSRLQHRHGQGSHGFSDGGDGLDDHDQQRLIAGQRHTGR